MRTLSRLFRTSTTTLNDDRTATAHSTARTSCCGVYGTPSLRARDAQAAQPLRFTTRRRAAGAQPISSAPPFPHPDHGSVLNISPATQPSAQRRLMMTVALLTLRQRAAEDHHVMRWRGPPQSVMLPLAAAAPARGTCRWLIPGRDEDCAHRGEESVPALLRRRPPSRHIRLHRDPQERTRRVFSSGSRSSSPP